MGRSHPNGGHAIAEPWYKASALAEIVAVAGKGDEALARSLIDRALNRFLDHPEEFLSWTHMGGGGSGLAAWVAYQARLAGYADMESVVGRVLACRVNTLRDSPRHVAEMHAKTAMTLALTDPVTAKWLLDRAAPSGQPVPGELVNRREWLFAVVMADPERGMAEIDRRIERAKSSQEAVRGTDLIELLITVTQPTEADLVRELGGWASVAWPRERD